MFCVLKLNLVNGFQASFSANRIRIKDQLEKLAELQKKAKEYKSVSFAPITGHMQTTRKVCEKFEVHIEC